MVEYSWNAEKQNLVDNFVLGLYEKYKDNSESYNLPNVNSQNPMERFDMQFKEIIDAAFRDDVENFFENNYDVLCPGLDTNNENDYKLLDRYFKEVIENIMQVIQPHLSNFEVTVTIPVKKEEGFFKHNPFKREATEQMEIVISKVLNENGKYDLHYSSKNSKFQGQEVIIDSNGKIMGHVGKGKSSTQLEEIATDLYRHNKGVDFVHEEFMKTCDTKSVKYLVMRVIDGAEKKVEDIKTRILNYNKSMHNGSGKPTDGSGKPSDGGKV
jgi:hypothetical protein